MLKLWGRANSINVQKALYCIEELGLPYERETPDAATASSIPPNIER